MIYGHVVACTGWTWDEVDRLTLPRYRELERYWRAHPPLHLMVAAYLGIEAAEDAVWDDMALSPADMAEMARGLVH